MPQAEQFVNDDLIRLGWLWSNGCSIRGARQKEDCGYPKEEEITWRARWDRMMKKHRSQKPSPNEVNDRKDGRMSRGKKLLRLLEMSRSE